MQYRLVICALTCEDNKTLGTKNYTEYHKEKHREPQRKTKNAETGDQEAVINH